MKQRYILLVLAIVSIASCTNPDPKLKADCGEFVTALLDKDEEVLGEVFGDLLKNTDPNSWNEDPLGHEKNFDKVVNEINESCEDISAYVLCYACIKTLPVQTEIILEFNVLDSMITRVVDIITPENKELRYFRVHE